jgi:hypothetical protein
LGGRAPPPPPPPTHPGGPRASDNPGLGNPNPTDPDPSRPQPTGVNVIDPINGGPRPPQGPVGGPGSPGQQTGGSKGHGNGGSGAGGITANNTRPQNGTAATTTTPGGKQGSSKCFGLNLPTAICASLAVTFPVLFLANLVTMSSGSKTAPPEYQNLPGEVRKGLLEPSLRVAQQALGGSIENDPTALRVNPERLLKAAENGVRGQQGAALQPTLYYLIRATDPAQISQASSQVPIDLGRMREANAALVTRLEQVRKSQWRNVAAFRALRIAAERTLTCNGGEAGIHNSLPAYYSAIRSLKVPGVGTLPDKANLAKALNLPDQSIAEFVFVAVATKRHCPDIERAGLQPFPAMGRLAPTLLDTYSDWMGDN